MNEDKINREQLLNNALQLIERHKVTAYELEKNTGFSAVGIQKIIDGKTKRPQEHTLISIISYINSLVSGNKKNVDADKVAANKDLLRRVEGTILELKNNNSLKTLKELDGLLELKYKIIDVLKDLES